MDLREHLNALVNSIPKGVFGVYYFHDAEGNMIYIGKSIDVRKRVQQHFAAKERKEIKLQLLTKTVSFENTGSELIALLRESELIKQHQPKFNRAQRKVKFFYGIVCETDKHGYQSLQVKKLNDVHAFIATYTSQNEAKEHLFRITERYQLCQKINGLYKSSKACFHYSIRQCNGACIQKEAIENYNERVQQFLESLDLPKNPILIEVAGRAENEKGLVLIADGQYKGFGYCSTRTKKHELMLKKIEAKQDNKDVRKILFRYLKGITNQM